MGIKAFQPHLEGKYSVPNLGQSIALQQRSIIFSIVDHSVALKAIACDLTHRKIGKNLQIRQIKVLQPIDSGGRRCFPGTYTGRKNEALLQGDAFIAREAHPGRHATIAISIDSKHLNPFDIFEPDVRILATNEETTTIICWFVPIATPLGPPVSAQLCTRSAFATHPGE
ncbi:hypothetical protein PSPO01_14844 [Paraphaeosphaeria sporulosa]